MSLPNRYSPPKATEDFPSNRAETAPMGSLARVITGRRLLMISLFTIIIGFSVQWSLGYARWLYEASPNVFLYLGASSVLVPLALAPIVAIVGAFRLSGGLGHTKLSPFFFACLMVIPVVNLVVMAWLVIKANRALSLSGYKAGVFGLRQV
jgi:hypothetical protein